MIEVLARQLKLPLLAGFEQHISKEADFADNLLHLLQLETLDKERRGIERRTRTAGFPTSASWTPSSSPPSGCRDWTGTRCTNWRSAATSPRRGMSLPSGTAELARPSSRSPWGWRRSGRGFTVRFRKVSDLVNQLTEAQNEGRLSRCIKSLNTCQLLICDELGYLHYDLQGASLLFQVFAARDEVCQHPCHFQPGILEVAGVPRKRPDHVHRPGG